MNDDFPLPRICHYPNYQRSAAGEIIDLMAGLNRPLDGWQQFVVTHGLGQVWEGDRDPDTGLPMPQWAAGQCGCWAPRQNGKGDIILALEMAWLYLFSEPLSLHTAHEYKTAQEGFLRIKGLIQSTDWADRLVNRYWQANGEQGIELTAAGRNARLRFIARSRSSGRGFSVAKLILDEAQELTEAIVTALLYAMSAQVSPQVWFFGTPPDDPAAWIYRVRKQGLKRAARFAYFDWGIETIDFDDRRRARQILSDPETWKATNPAIGSNRPSAITVQTVADELSLVGPSVRFAMDRCGMWLPSAEQDEEESTIDPAVWDALVSDPVRPAEFAIGFHVNMRRTHATVGFAGKVDGMWRVGLIHHDRQVDALLARLLAVKKRYNPLAFVVDAKSETILVDLRERGIRLPEDAERPVRGDLILPTAGDVATSHGMLVDAVRAKSLRHHNESPLNAAITAPTRPLAGGATWDHRAGKEVGPAIAVQLAMWAYRERFGRVAERPHDPLSNIW